MSEEQQPIPPVQTDFTPELPAERGGCLTTFLVVMIIVNALVVLNYLIRGASVLETFPDAPAWSVYVLALFGLVNIFFAYQLWQWKKIGFYGFIVSAICIFGFNLFIGVGVIGSVLGLLGPVVLYLVLRPVWQHLK